MKKPGNLFIISAPSGCGKTTLCNRILRTVPRVERSVSCTTRKPRRGEKDKRDYFFVSEKKFKELEQQGKLLESAHVVGARYGTPTAFVEKKLRQGFDVLLSIDVQGAQKIRAKKIPCVLVFIKPPSLKELSKRLRERSTETAGEISRRLKVAREELACAGKYDYAVVNDNLNEAVALVRSIILAERCRMRS